MTIKQEAIQLFRAILLFQQKIQNQKQVLFFKFETTDTLLWNHIVGSSQSYIYFQHLYNYFIKYSKSYNQTDVKHAIKLFFYEYSTSKQQKMCKKDFMYALMPNECIGLQQILSQRNKKYSYSKTHIPHYRLIDQIITILEETFKFLLLKQEMKKNVYIKKLENQLQIQKPEAQYLLIFVNDACPTWSIKQCTILLNHIFKNKCKCLKEFYYFFVPYQCLSQKLNPNIKILPNQSIQRFDQTYQTVINHKKLANFGSKIVQKRNVLYLKRKK